METKHKPYRSAIIFEESLPKTAPPPEPELKVQQHFDHERVQFALADSMPKASIEKEMEIAVNPKENRWILKTIIASGFGLTALQTVSSIYTAWTTGDLLYLLWTGFFAGIASLAGAACFKEFTALRNLKKQEIDKHKVEEIIKEGGFSNAKPMCETMAKRFEGEITLAYDQWLYSLSKTHSDKEVFELFDAMVLKEQDKIAQQMIMKSASESAVLVALSPLAIVDVLLVAWRNMRLLNQISENYGVKLSYYARLRLMKLVVANMAFAGATEALASAGTEMLSMDLLGRLSTNVAQGLGVGLLSARLGLKAMEMMRPLPYLTAPEPKLADMRKQLLLALSPKSKEK